MVGKARCNPNPQKVDPNMVLTVIELPDWRNDPSIPAEVKAETEEKVSAQLANPRFNKESCVMIDTANGTVAEINYWEHRMLHEYGLFASGISVGGVDKDGRTIATRRSDQNGQNKGAVSCLAAGFIKVPRGSLKVGSMLCLWDDLIFPAIREELGHEVDLEGSDFIIRKPTLVEITSDYPTHQKEFSVVVKVQKTIAELIAAQEVAKGSPGSDRGWKIREAIIDADADEIKYLCWMTSPASQHVFSLMRTIMPRDEGAAEYVTTLPGVV